MKKRILSVFLSCLLLLSLVPAPMASAQEVPKENGTCEHHKSHSRECGYTENSPCTFACGICRVQSLIDALPSREEVSGMGEDEQVSALQQAAAADTAFKALEEKDKAQLLNAENITELLAYFDEVNATSVEKTEKDSDMLNSTDGQDQPQNQAETQGYDTMVIVGADGYGDIQSALDSLSENSGNVMLRIDSNVSPNKTTSYQVPADKGIDSLTIGTLDGNAVEIGNYEVRFYANGVPLIIESGITFKNNSAIYGGGAEESTSVSGGSSITVNSGASVGGIYGGGRNRSLDGNVDIKVNGSASYVYGGGYADSYPVTEGNTKADVNGNVTIEIDGAGSSLSGDLHGGGNAYSTTGSGAVDSIQANVSSDVSIKVDCPSVGGNIYGGGNASHVNQTYSRSVYADIGGNVSITIGGGTQHNGSRHNVYGGGCADALSENAAVVSARVSGAISIDASADHHATSGHDDWDASMFQSFYGGGYANGSPANAEVGSTDILISRKALDDEEGLFGGGYAKARGNADVIGDTYVEIVRAEGQADGHDNAKAVYGGGSGNYGSASVRGNTTVRINSEITFEPGGKSGPHGGGKASGSTGVSNVGGTATVIMDGSTYAVVPGGRAADDVPAENCTVSAAAVQILGTADLSLKTGASIADELQVIIGDGSKETKVKTNYIYCGDSLNSKVAVQVMDKASLVQNVNNQQMFFNVTDLTIAKTGSVTVNNTKDGAELINGRLSGEGQLTLPSNRNLQVNSGGSLAGNLTINLGAGKNLTVYGGFTGNTTLNLTGDPKAGDLVAWTKMSEDGEFTYEGNGLALAATESDPWNRWNLAATKKVQASVNGTGGSVSPQEQEVVIGSQAMITVQSDPGYKVGAATVDGEDKTASLEDGVLTLDNVQEDIHVIISFEKLTVPEIEENIEALPTPDPEKPDTVPKETILDVKMDYESLPEQEKEKVSADTRDKLNSALAGIPNVEVTYSGIATVEDPETLLENMSGTEAAALKNGDYKAYKIEVVIAESKPGSEDEKNSINSVLNGASEAMYNDVTIKKIITMSDDPDHPLENQLTVLPRPIRLVFPIPEDLRAVPDHLVRRFMMLRTHWENNAYMTTVLEDQDNDPETYTVMSDQFSLYTLAYTDNMAAYLITASAGKGGTISPSGVVKVEKDGTQTFTITSDSGYTVQDVLVDGKSVGKVNSYTFSDITADHKITASFVKDSGTGDIPGSSNGNTSGGASGNKPSSGSGNVPGTGDSTNLLIWLAALMISGAAVLSMLLFRKKSNK